MADMNLEGGTLTCGAVVGALGAITALSLPDQTANPAAIAGSLQITSFLEDGGTGAGLPWAIPETGSPYALGIAPWAKTWAMLQANSAAASVVTSGNSQATTSGTISSATITGNGLLSNFATAATANSQAYLRTSAVTRPGATGNLFGGYWFHSRFYLPDASYSSGSGARFCVGMSNNPATDLASDHGSASVAHAMFAYSAATSDTDWQFSCCSSSAQNVMDTGMAFNAQHVYKTVIFCPVGSATLWWLIADLTAATYAAGSTSTDLPSAISTLTAFAGLTTLDTTARNFQFASIYVRADAG